MAFEIAKAGWMYRQSSILHRWKKNWVVLYQSGDLKYFESPDSHVAEECLKMGSQCLSIKTTEQITGVDPPEGLSRKCLLAVVFRDSTLNLCAESPDDCSAWHIALEQSRVVQQLPAQPMPPPYAPHQGAQVAYPQQVQQTVVYPQQVQQRVVYTNYPGYPGTHPPAYVVQSPPGQTTVIYTDNPCRYRRRYPMGGPLLWW